MAEILRGRGKVLGSLALGALVFAGCNEPDTQVGQANYVDCDNGPKTGSVEMELTAGSIVELDISGGGDFYTAHPHLTLISDGQGGVQVDTEDTHDGRLPNQMSGALNYTDENGIMYKISSSKVNEGTSHLLIDLSCPPQQSLQPSPTN